MDTRTTRIRNLGAYLEQHCQGNRSELARRAGRPPNLINDLFAKGSTKSFGERLARDLEKKLGLAELSLDMNPFGEQPQVRHAPGRWPHRIAQHRYDALRDEEREIIETMVERMVISFEAERGPTRPHGTGNGSGERVHNKIAVLRRRRV